MANTTSAKKAVRKIAARTEVNRTRRGRVRTYVRKVEEAIASGDQNAAAAALKAAEPWRFLGVVRLYGLGAYSAAGVAIVLPALEVTLAAAMLFPRLRSAALWIAVGVFVAFAVVQGVVLTRGVSLPCGCLGSNAPVSAWTLIRTLALATAAATAASLSRSPGNANSGAPAQAA